jgi:hypothetical protein
LNRDFRILTETFACYSETPHLEPRTPEAHHRRAKAARLLAAAKVGYFFLITNKKFSCEATSRGGSFSYCTSNRGPGGYPNKEKDLNKNNLFPLMSRLFASPNPSKEKGSFLNKKTYDYLNTVSPKNLRGNLNADLWRIPGKKQKITPAVQPQPSPLLPPSGLQPSTGGAKAARLLFAEVVASSAALPPQGIYNQPSYPTALNLDKKIGTGLESLKGDHWKQKVASIKTSLKVNDVIYQYLKTFSIFNKRKNGILIKYNQHIGYNFNSKNILLRGVAGAAVAVAVAVAAVEPKISTLVNKSLLKKNIVINYYLNGPLLKKKEPKINKKIATEINRLKGVSGLTGYNRSGNNRLIKYSYKLLFYFFKSMYCLISKPVFLFTPDKVTIQLFYFLNIPKFKVFKWYSILNNKLIRQKWYATSLRFNKNIDALAALQLGQGAGHRDKLSNLNIPSDTEHLLPAAQTLSTSNKLKTVLSLSNKEMMNRVKLRWRIKKTLFRLNKKRNKVKHILFNLNKFNLFKVFSLKFKLICEILSNKFKKPVELHLVRIHQPFHDSNILVNLLSLNIRRNKKFKTNVKIEKLYAKKAVKNLYDYSNNSVNFIPTFLSGIKIRIGGRLMREALIPRITSKKFERGASSPGKVNFLDTATITKKNRKGSYTIKISSGQNFF